MVSYQRYEKTNVNDIIQGPAILQYPFNRQAETE